MLTSSGALTFLLNQSWEGSNMRRLLLISLVTVPLTGCQFFNRGEDVAVIDLVEAVESGEAIPDAPQFGGGDSLAEAEAAEADEAFADPTVESDSPGVVSADLIRSTDPAARTRQVERSRLDPFATLPIPPPPEPVELPEAATTRAASSNSGAAGANAASNASSEPTPPPVRVQPNNAPLVVPSPIATLPPIPQPVIAPTVSVSGVVQLGNEPYAILRSGSEPERYVRVGDRIAGGAVRVKRIETLAFEPRVILEENGIEVARPISAGESESPDEAPEAAAEPVAASPASASSPLATVPVVAPSASASTLPVPPATVSDTQASNTQASNTQAVVPGITLSIPTSATLPAPGEVPSSLVLLPADPNT
ncbi:MAG: hypothetical protein AAFV46_09050 [Cyanobacteria bacterium J06635_11]